MKTNNNVFAYVVSGGIGGALFIIFLLILGFSTPNLLISLGIGIAGYVGSVLLFAPKKQRELEYKGVRGISESYVRETIREGIGKIRIIYNYKKPIRNRQIDSNIDEICDTANKIFSHFEKDPKNISNTRGFILYILDTTIKILDNYENISNKNLSTPEIEAVLEKAENSLVTIKEAFKKQLAKILQDNVFDLDSEIEVLEERLEMEDNYL